MRCLHPKPITLGNFLRTIESFLKIRPVTPTSFASLSSADGLMHSALTSSSAPPRPSAPLRLRALSALDNIDDDSLPLVECADVRSFESRDVDKHIFAAAVPRDEAVALLWVEPFHRTGLLDTGIGKWAVRCRRQSPWYSGSGDAAVEAQHLRYVRSRVAGADSNFESIAGLYGADAAPREHTSVEEALVGLIGELDEPKSLLWAEPFDNCAN